MRTWCFCLGTPKLWKPSSSLFVDWCKRTVRSIGIDELFDKLPSFAGQCLRSYGDILYQHGGALSNYRHCILALQRWKPLCRPYMHGPWELVRRWEFQEPVAHRPPLPEGVVKGLVTLAWQFEWYDWCGVTLISFYGAGRLGEVLRCLRSDLILPADTIGEISHSAFLELRRFKSLNRQPSKIQHMKVTDKYCVKLLGMIYKNYAREDRLFDGSADQYRRRWDFLLKTYGIDKSLRLTPGGLRGGSAVWAYRHAAWCSTTPDPMESTPTSPWHFGVLHPRNCLADRLQQPDLIFKKQPTKSCRRF